MLQRQFKPSRLLPFFRALSWSRGESVVWPRVVVGVIQGPLSEPDPGRQ